MKEAMIDLMDEIVESWYRTSMTILLVVFGVITYHTLRNLGFSIFSTEGIMATVWALVPLIAVFVRSRCLPKLPK